MAARSLRYSHQRIDASTSVLSSRLNMHEAVCLELGYLRQPIDADFCRGLIFLIRP